VPDFVSDNAMDGLSYVERLWISRRYALYYLQHHARMARLVQLAHGFEAAKDIHHAGETSFNEPVAAVLL